MWIHKHWAALCGLLLTALYIYLQLLQWQKHGDDFMLTAASIVVTVLLWGTLLAGFSQYRRDGKRAKVLEGALVTAKDDHDTKLKALGSKHAEEITTLKTEHLKQLDYVKDREKKEYEKWKDQEYASWRLDAASAQGKLRESLEAEIAQLKAQIAQPKLSREQLNRVMLAGALIQFAAESDGLNGFLEKIWHIWDNDGQKLKMPLAGSIIGNEVRDHRDFELLRFRYLYRNHIAMLNQALPDFHTNLVDEGFPTNDDYLTVRRKIEAHAAFLRERADREARPLFDGAGVP